MAANYKGKVADFKFAADFIFANRNFNIGGSWRLWFVFKPHGRSFDDETYICNGSDKFVLLGVFLAFAGDMSIFKIQFQHK